MNNRSAGTIDNYLAPYLPATGKDNKKLYVAILQRTSIQDVVGIHKPGNSQIPKQGGDMFSAQCLA